MSDKSELQQRAEEVLVDLINKAAEIGSAAVDEIPLVVQELLTWKFAESLLMTLGGVGIMFVILFIYKKVYNFYKDKELINHPESMFLLFTIFAWIPVFIMINFDWLKNMVSTSCIFIRIRS